MTGTAPTATKRCEWILPSEVPLACQFWRPRVKYYERNRSNNNKRLRVDPSIRSPTCMFILTFRSMILWEDLLNWRKMVARGSFWQKSRVHVDFDYERINSNSAKWLQVDPSSWSPACTLTLMLAGKILWKDPFGRQKLCASWSFYGKSRLHVDFDVGQYVCSIGCSNVCNCPFIITTKISK